MVQRMGNYLKMCKYRNRVFYTIYTKIFPYDDITIHLNMIN